MILFAAVWYVSIDAGAEEMPLPNRSTANPPSTPARMFTATEPAWRVSTAPPPVPSIVNPRKPPASVTGAPLIAEVPLTPRIPWFTNTWFNVVFAADNLSNPIPDLVSVPLLASELEIRTPPAALLF